MSTRVNTPGARNPKVIPFSCSPAVAEIAMMNRSAGKAMIISVSRETTVSTPPRK